MNKTISRRKKPSSDNVKVVKSLANTAVVCLMTTGIVNAAVSYTDVWYPDGQINYFIKADILGAQNEIDDVMTYMSDYTPLSIEKVFGANAANLKFKGTWLSPNGGGYTYAYWDENRSDSHKKIRFDPNHLPSRSTVAHEFGHALGRPHEFQRDDRDDHVDVCFNVDPFNYKPVGTIYWPDPYYNLSPYDHASVMNDGYSGCVEDLPADSHHSSRAYETVSENILSVHDINGIYRMYGAGLGKNDPGDRFGVAVSSGDYDDDGYKDIVVANVQNNDLWLSFYRGVGPDHQAENITGLRWMPWFKVVHELDVGEDANVALATGDFNGDGIDDVAVGQPNYNGDNGLVSILFVNSLPSDPDKFGTLAEDVAPWGHKGVEYRIDITPQDVGLTTFIDTHPQFGASLAAVHATNYRNDDNDTYYHDLVIGAPRARPPITAFDRPVKGAIAIIKGRQDNSPADFSIATNELIWNPFDIDSEFGAAVAAVPGLCALSGQDERFYNDYIAVGAPEYFDKGAVFVFGCATSGTSSTLTIPLLKSSIVTTAQGGRYGHALAGFRVYDGQDRTSYLVVGQPDHTNVTDNKKVGHVELIEMTSDTGGFNSVGGIIPDDHDGNDDFGYAIAVQQRPTDTNEGSLETYIGIGMPGAKVDGVKAGRVFVWRPFDESGNIVGNANFVDANNPDPASNSRFGESIAVLRPLKQKGGFVVGTPEAITLPDHIQAGQVSALQNDGDDFSWSAVRQNINQETDGDKRPTNL